MYKTIIAIFTPVIKLNTNMKLKTKLIGLYELISGIFGFILIAYKMLSNTGESFSSVEIFFSYLLGLLLFAGLTYAGYAILNTLKNGIKYSIWLQVLQIFAFTTGGIKYLFTGAAFVSIQIQNGIAFKINDKVIDYAISKVSALTPDSLSIFLLPILILVLLNPKKSLFKG